MPGMANTDQLPIYVLNLDRDRDRLEMMAGQLDAMGLQWQRFPGLDARQDVEREVSEYVDAKDPIVHVPPGGRACTAGHFRFWKAFLQGDAPAAIILEDDSLLSPALADFVRSPGAWVDQVDVLNINRKPTRRPVKKILVSTREIPLDDGFAMARLMGPHFGTGGYAITRKGAHKLIDGVQRTSTHVDFLLFNPNLSAFARNEEVYQLYPSLTEQDQGGFISNVTDDAGQKQRSLWKKLRRLYYEVYRVPYTLFMIAMRKIRVLELYFKDKP